MAMAMALPVVVWKLPYQLAIKTKLHRHFHRPLGWGPGFNGGSLLSGVLVGHFALCKLKSRE